MRDFQIVHDWPYNFGPVATDVNLKRRTENFLVQYEYMCFLCDVFRELLNIDLQPLVSRSFACLSDVIVTVVDHDPAVLHHRRHRCTGRATPTHFPRTPHISVLRYALPAPRACE